jgi:TolB-like protein
VSRVRGTAEGVAIAVLPFQNFSGQAREEYAADSTTEALITALAQVSELRIISRTSSMHYKGSTKPLPEIARELEVEWIVEGSVIRSARGIRVTAQLIDAQHDEHVWARAYDEPPGDILQLHKRIIGAIAAAVAGVVIPRSGGPSPITPSAVAPAAVTPSVSTGARDRGGRAPRAQWHAPEPESRNGTASAGTNSH